MQITDTQKEINKLIGKWKKTLRKKIKEKVPYEEEWCICQVISDLLELLLKLK